MSHEQATPVSASVEQSPAPRAIVPLAPPAPNDPPERWPTSLDLSTAAGQALLVRMSGPPTLNVAECGESEYTIINYLLRPAEHEDEETGEISQYTQLSLLTDDGDIIGSPGPVLIRKWILVMRMRGVPSATNPIRIRVQKADSRRQGRRYDDLELVAGE